MRIPSLFLELICLLLLLLTPNLAALKVDVLGDQTWAICLAGQGRVFTDILLRNEQAILRLAVHDQVLELDTAHASLRVQITQLHECPLRRYSSPLIPHCLILRGVSERVLFAAF